MDPIENLLKFELELPEVSTPGGSYASVNIRGNIAYIAIQFPIKNNSNDYCLDLRCQPLYMNLKK